MGKLFNSKILYLIPIIFLMVIAFRITISYNNMKKQEYNFAKKSANVLKDYAMIDRNYYQSLYLHKIIPLNEKTLAGLPAFSSHIISKDFSIKNSLNISLQTVSDRPRNQDNQADKDELNAIDYFKNNTEKESFFSDKNTNYYQFAYVLKIEDKCLKCHGNIAQAPLFIQNKYKEAYNYKLGEVRGIMSIKIPKKTLDEYFYPSFINSIIYDMILFVLVFFGIYYLVKKSKNLNRFLELKIKSKTRALKNSLIYDSLTLLPNRHKLIEDINKAEVSSLHLALLNIDSFKDINDFYGHAIGDKILQRVATTIEHTCKGSDNIVYKLPSDEYALLNTKKITEDEFLKIVQKVIDTINNLKLTIEGNQIFIALSCGIVSNETYLIAKADMSLQSAKKIKKDIIVYTKDLDMTLQLNKNIQGIALLKKAISTDTIIPYFQPIYNIKTKTVEKYESLARIITENGEVILPFKFIDIAIKSKLYPNITNSMIKKSFDFFKNKQYEFSINLSINQDILNKNTFKFIMDSLTSFPEPNRVVFEILETDKVANYQELKIFIQEVKKFGCKIAIDDFGSGYSNFSHILELNVDYLKIDASLVKNILTDSNSKKITKTIINFAANLELQTIAEYVENKEALELLKEMGVDYIQGYYIGKPEANILDNPSFD